MNPKLKYLFDYTIKEVTPVETVMKDLLITGYRFFVNYEHHKPQMCYFDVNDERLYTTYRSPEHAANEEYKNYCNKMRRQQARIARRALAKQK